MNNKNLAIAYRETSLESKFMMYNLDTNKIDYIDEGELRESGLN